MKNQNTVFKKVITILVLTAVLMALLFGAALFNHFFNRSENENEIENGFNPPSPPNNSLPRDPILPPALE